MKTTEELIHETVIEMTSKEKPEEVEKIEKMVRAVILEGTSPKDAMKIDQKALDMLYDLAYQHYDGGNYKNALLLFVFLSGIDPKNVKYRMGIAASLHMNKQFQEAIDAYLICASLDPKNPLPFYHMSDCFVQLKDLFRAYYFLKTSIVQAKSNPTRYATLIQRGELACKSLLNDMKKIPYLENMGEMLPMFNRIDEDEKSFAQWRQKKSK